MMNPTPIVFGGILIVSVAFPVASAAQGVRSSQSNDQLRLHCGDVAHSLGYTFKVITRGQLVTFCKSAPTEICIPVRITPRTVSESGSELYVSAEVLAKALGFRYSRSGTKVLVEAISTREDSQPGEGGYNEAWGRGRGFGVGDTVPDIPLVNLDGREVRFSEFLGKRYILYCWASW